ncbi:tRNA synthetase class II core domain (G, H, P, S and T) [Popillia japonica]|uniref:serine--tRNA ligase n=1 Tax=Popillia japonica TaxID=7064 RepID=A0AAW1LCG4_POPJA
MRKSIISVLNKTTFYSISTRLWHVQHAPELNFTYLCNGKNLDDISANIQRRKDPKYEDTKRKFLSECKNIPNATHPDIIGYNDEPRIVKYIGEKKEFKFKPKEFHEIAKRLNLIRTEQLGYLSGHRSYYLLGDLANLEHALTQYTLNNLIRQNFKVVTVPDILHRDIIESCGLNTRGDRTQVYQLDEQHGHDLCLSGTSEMALAGFLMNRILLEEKELPLKLATVSRCFRAETSSIADEKGIYRVHEFTKVEIFIATKPEESNKMLEEIRNIEEEHFTTLGLHLRTLDMPPHELGAPAYRKYDIEAWMPGRQMFGEISSCSNCTDYQSRRLNIKYNKIDGSGSEFVHTLNGTACAVPRMLIALLEMYQNDNGTITVPDCLRKYLRNKEVIRRQKSVPELMLIKNKK